MTKEIKLLNAIEKRIKKRNASNLVNRTNAVILKKRETKIDTMDIIACTRVLRIGIWSSE